MAPVHRYRCFAQRRREAVRMKSSALSLKGLFAPEHAVPKGVSKTSRDFGEQLKWCL